MQVVLVTGLWTVSIGLMVVATWHGSMYGLAWSLLLGLIAMVPSLRLVFECAISRERQYWMRGLADSMARAMLEEAEASELRRIGK